MKRFLEREKVMPQRLLVLCGLLAAFFAVPALQAQAAHPVPAAVGHAASASSFGHAPIAFEPNVGQADPHVRFLVHGPGYTLFLTDKGMVVTVPHQAVAPRINHLSPHLSVPRATGASVIRLSFLGGSVHPRFAGMSKLPGKVNYFIGNNPKRWHTSIPTFARVTVGSVYPGISLALYGHAGQLEYDWVVAPHADVSRIHLEISGPGTLQVDHSGAVQLRGGSGSLIEGRPVVYQRVGGVVRHITAGYRLQNHAISFQLGQYDHRLPLTIDPTLVYSTYLGGSDTQQGQSTALDSNGDLFVTGGTFAADFPTHNPYQGTYIGGTTEMAFVTEFNPSGSALIFSTYFGGSHGNVGTGIALDRYGDVYLAGYTVSTDFPTANPLQASNQGGVDVFITKLNPTGSALIFSTYLGGSTTDAGFGIAVDHYGYAYVTGETDSTDFTVSNALYSTNGGSLDAFVAKIFPSGDGLVYSTYLGGISNDVAAGIAVDSTGDAYVAGYTSSPNFPTASAYQGSYGTNQDAFITKLNPSGSSLLFSTYLGGSASEVANAIALDPTGRVYVTGQTSSTNFPTLNAYQPAFSAGATASAFVSRFSAAGALSYSTYLGGNGTDSGQGIAVDGTGAAYITGFTSSTTFPVQAAVQGTNAGSNDAFVSRLAPSGSALLFSSYLGGDGDDAGYGIVTDGKGYAYVTGHTDSTNFPTATPFQPARASTGSNNDAFVTKLSVLGVTFAPASASALSTFTISGSAWMPSDSITVVWNCATPSCTSAYTWNTTADVNGNFTINTAVPNYSPGPRPVIVKSTNSGYVLTSFTVAPAPAISFRSANGSTGSFATVSGTGFRPHELVTVKWNCSSLSCSSLTTLVKQTADNLGSFASVFSVPLGWSPGTYPVGARGATSNSFAVANFTVISATMAVSPTSGHAGSAATVTGTGFRPGETVIVKWNCATIDCTSLYELRAKHELVPMQDAPIRLTAVVANSSGNISKPITIPSGFSVGSYPIAATGDYSNTFAKTTFTIN
jgi:hypothetical protein